MGDKSRVEDLPSASLIAATLREIHQMVEDMIDRIKTDAGDIPVIAVGGGAFLVPDQMKGVSRSSRCRMAMSPMRSVPRLLRCPVNATKSFTICRAIT